MTPREFVREFFSGCLSHFVVGVAALILLGIGGRHLGLSRLAIFVLVVVVVFLLSVVIRKAKAKVPPSLGTKLNEAYILIKSKEYEKARQILLA